MIPLLLDLIKDIRSVQLTPAQAGSSGRAPHLIRVKHWFSAGRGAYVDARNRTRVQMEVLEEEEENLPVAPPAQEEEELATSDGPLALQGLSTVVV